MDVYYMSDSIQYGSFRNPLYRDYEKFPYGTLENPLNSPPKSSQQLQQQRNGGGYNMAQGKSKTKPSKDACPFCKEQKKRPLGAYLRKRGQRIHSESISEDVEDCEGEQEESAGSGTEQSSSNSPNNHELNSHNHHHHHHAEGSMVSGNYSRQESQDSDGK